MRNSTLCYVEKDGCYLMMHRVKKEHDLNRDKWIGIGGGFLEDESPEDCVKREALEETGLTLEDPKLLSVVTFVIEGGECEHMFLFKAKRFPGNLTDCDEGTLEWVPKEKIYGLDLWEGDKIFLRKIEKDCDFFTLKL
ncbi:MAG: NUDIX domain-containing protein, partial [Clostridia bacterium]|nr:NUDIX domain-containing protein [Clostridia bacterium]